MLRKQIKNQQGFTILSGVLAAAIILASIAIYSFSQKASINKQNDIRQDLLAKAYAIELLELFRSFDTGSGLIANYLKKVHPGQSSAYALCTSVNLFNRATQTTTNPDAVADMPPSALDRGSPSMNAHRSYQVRVVDATTMALLENSSWCGVAPTTSSPVTVDTLPSNALIAVTVTVTWIPLGGTITDEKTLELSTVLPVLGRTDPTTGLTS